MTRSLADGLRLFLTAIVVQEMSGLSLPLSVALVGVTTIAYTYVGGMKAVVWTDVVQFVIYIVGAVVAFALLLGRCPGAGAARGHGASAAGKFRWLDLSTALDNPYTLWAGLIGGMFLTFGSHGADQLMVQRYLCARSQREAARALWMSGVVVLPQFALFLLIGVGLFVFYQAFPPAVPFRPARPCVRPLHRRAASHGVVGLVIGAVFAAAMSTLSSSLNSSATAPVTDFYRPLARPDATSGHLLRVTRGLTLFFGLVQIAVALGGPLLSRTVVESVLTIAGFTTGIILGVFFLGIFTRRVGQRAALAGLLAGLLLISRRGFRHDAGLALVHAGGVARDVRVRPGREPGLAAGRAPPLSRGGTAPARDASARWPAPRRRGSPRRPRRVRGPPARPSFRRACRARPPRGPRRTPGAGAGRSAA